MIIFPSKNFVKDNGCNCSGKGFTKIIKVIDKRFIFYFILIFIFIPIKSFGDTQLIPRSCMR